MGNSNLFNSHTNHLKETIQANRYEIIIVKLHKGVDDSLKMNTGHFLMASKLCKLNGKKK